MRSRLLTPLLTLLVVLLGLLLVAPAAHAQSAAAPDGVRDPQFSSPEVRRLGEEITAQNQEYARNEKRMEELDYGSEYDRLEDRQDEIEDSYTRNVEAFVRARMDAISGEPLTGSPEAKRKILEAKQAAVESLESYASDQLSVSSDYYPSYASSYYPDYSSQIEAARAREAAAEEKAEAAPESSGGGPEQEQPQEPAPEKVEETNSGPDILTDINLVPILVFAALVGAAIFALSRSAGLSVRQFFSPAMARAKKSKPKPKQKPAQKQPEKSPEKPAAKTGPNPKDSPEPEKPRPEPGAGEDLSTEELERLFNRPSPGEPGGGDDGEPPD